MPLVQGRTAALPLREQPPHAPAVAPGDHRRAGTQRHRAAGRQEALGPDRRAGQLRAVDRAQRRRAAVGDDQRGHAAEVPAARAAVAARAPAPPLLHAAGPARLRLQPDPARLSREGAAVAGTEVGPGPRALRRQRPHQDRRVPAGPHARPHVPQGAARGVAHDAEGLRASAPARAASGSCRAPGWSSWSSSHRDGSVSTVERTR